MQSNHIKVLFAFAAIVAATLPIPAARAQNTNPPPAPQNAQPSGQPAAKPEGRTEAPVEQRIAELYKKLQITEAQKPQWDQFAQTMRENAANMRVLYNERGNQLDSMSAVENMQSYAKIAEQHAADMQKLLPVFQALYNTFSDRQKAAADEAFRASAERHIRRHGQPQRSG